MRTFGNRVASGALALGAGLLLSTALAGGAAAQNQQAVDAAKAAVQDFAGPQNEWKGPTSSPQPQPGKRIVYVANDERNDAVRNWGEAMQDAAKAVGWEVTVMDGQGSPVGWQAAMNQAIAVKPDAIVTSADARSLQDQIKQANGQGIIVVGIHATDKPGPVPELGLYYNIQQDPKEIGKAEADWIIAHSGGGDKCRAVVTTHGEFAIAFTKASATRDELQKAGCQVLEFNDSPIGEAQQRQPQLVTGWVQKYGTPLYITAVADYTLDFQIPALRSGGVDPSQVILVGADGNLSAYQRIRAGNQYQMVTVSEPYGMEGYQAIDELNRAFHGQPPSGFVPKPYLVTPDNVNAEGGDKNTFIPSNDYAQHYRELWGVKS